MERREAAGMLVPPCLQLGAGSLLPQQTGVTYLAGLQRRPLAGLRQDRFDHPPRAAWGGRTPLWGLPGCCSALLTSPPSPWGARPQPVPPALSLQGSKAQTLPRSGRAVHSLSPSSLLHAPGASGQRAPCPGTWCRQTQRRAKGSPGNVGWVNSCTVHLSQLSSSKSPRIQPRGGFITPSSVQGSTRHEPCGGRRSQERPAPSPRDGGLGWGGAASCCAPRAVSASIHQRSQLCAGSSIIPPAPSQHRLSPEARAATDQGAPSQALLEPGWAERQEGAAEKPEHGGVWVCFFPLPHNNAAISRTPRPICLRLSANRSPWQGTMPEKPQMA